MVAGSAKLMTMLTAVAALGASGATGGIPTFSSLDANGDGLVTGDEASARHGLRELMSEYDQNHDGGLDAEEYRRMLEEALREARRIGTGIESTHN